MTDPRIRTAICHLNALLMNGGATVYGPWLADTISLLENLLDRDDMLEVAAGVAESRYPAPPPGIYGHRASVHKAGLDIANAIRALKGGS